MILDVIKVNVGCGTHRADGWINTDAQRGFNVAPIEVQCTALPFRENSVDRIMLSHVMEHVPWPAVPDFLVDIHTVLAPGGMVCVVGPDVYKTIRRWAEGREPWDLLTSVLEHSQSHAHEALWPQARHWWNFTAGRAMSAFHESGFLTDPVEIASARLDEWPVVGRADWQSAFFAWRE